MDIVHLATVDQASKAGVRHLFGHLRLGLPQFRPLIIVYRFRGIDEHGQLRVEEGQPVITEKPTHIADEICQQLRVLGGSPGVLFALVKQHTSHCRRRHPLEHCFRQSAGTIGRTQAHRRIPGAHACLFFHISPFNAGIRRLDFRHAGIPRRHGSLERIFLRLPLGHGFVAHQSRVVVDVPDTLSALTQIFLIHPASDGGAAPIAVDDAHGNLQLIAQLHREEICNGRHIPAHARADGFPMAGSFRLAGLLIPQGSLGHVEIAQVRIIVDFDQAGAFVGILEFQLHVALSASQVDLTDGHVAGDNFRLAIGDDQGTSALRPLRRQTQQESALPRSANTLSQEAASSIHQPCGKTDALLRAAENAQLLISGQNRAVTKERCKLEHGQAPFRYFLRYSRFLRISSHRCLTQSGLRRGSSGVFSR